MALGLVYENNSDLSSDRLNSMNHKTDKTIRTSFWIEKLTKITQKNTGIRSKMTGKTQEKDLKSLEKIPD